MRDIHIQIKVVLQIGRLSDNFKRKERHGEPDMCMFFTDDALNYLIHVDNLLHELFSKCDMNF